jgi:5-keto 4-deoxyuronate isomerase
LGTGDEKIPAELEIERSELGVVTLGKSGNTNISGVLYGVSDSQIKAYPIEKFLIRRNVVP